MLAQLARAQQTIIDVETGEGKRRNELAEWHVVWLAE